MIVDWYFVCFTKNLISEIDFLCDGGDSLYFYWKNVFADILSVGLFFFSTSYNGGKLGNTSHGECQWVYAVSLP